MMRTTAKTTVTITMVRYHHKSLELLLLSFAYVYLCRKGTIDDPLDSHSVRFDFITSHRNADNQAFLLLLATLQ